MHDGIVLLLSLGRARHCRAVFPSPGRQGVAGRLSQALQTQSHISLAERLQTHPLQQGLGELLAYLQLASESPHSVVDEGTLESVQWAAQHAPETPEASQAGPNAGPTMRRATLPRVIFVRD